jgi:hypothetical protein
MNTRITPHTYIYTHTHSHTHTHTHLYSHYAQTNEIKCINSHFHSQTHLHTPPTLMHAPFFIRRNEICHVELDVCREMRVLYKEKLGAKLRVARGLDLFSEG